MFVPFFFFFLCSVFLGLRGEGERGSDAGEQDPWAASLIFWLGSSLCRSVAQGKLTKEQECRPQAGVEMRLVQMHRVRLFNLCAQMPFKDRQLVWVIVHRDASSLYLCGDPIKRLEKPTEKALLCRAGRGASSSEGGVRLFGG